MSRQIPGSECAQGKCGSTTTGCWGECSLRRAPIIYANSAQIVATPAQQAAPSDDLQSDFMDWAKRHYEPTLGDNWGCVTFASNGGMVALAAYKAGRMESFAATSSQAAPSVDVVIDGYTYDGQTIRAILQDWIDYGAEAHDARKRGAAQSQAAPDSRGIDYIMAAVESYASNREASTLVRIRRMISEPVPSQAAPSASIDTPEFCDLITELDAAHEEVSPARSKAGWAALVAHIDAWGAALARPAATEPAQEEDSDWRRLALQFDGHRMQAIGHLKCMVEDPAMHRSAAAEFLGAGPLSGEKVLEQRIAAIAANRPAATEPAPDADHVIAEAARSLAHRFFNGGIKTSADIWGLWDLVKSVDATPAATTGEPGQSRDGDQAPGDAKDAERYRWLRKTGGATWSINGHVRVIGADYDQAVDAAITSAAAPTDAKGGVA